MAGGINDYAYLEAPGLDLSTDTPALFLSFSKLSV